MRPLVLLSVCVVACAGTVGPPATAAVGPDSLTLVIAGTTDVHGWLRGWDYFAGAPDTTRGLARAATIVDSLRADHPGRVVLVDAGDDLQGTPLTNIALRDSTRPNPIVAAMNVMRYDAAVIGNHEFNYGLGYLGRVIAQASFPFIAANVYTADNRHAYTPWTMVTKSGVRVAIVGGTTPGSMIWDRDKLVGRVEVRDIVPSVRAAVNEARAQGAAVVVVVLHSGLSEPSSYDTVATGLPSENVTARVAREIPGIDVVVFGHTHRELADTTIGGALVTQPRNAAGSVSVSRLALVRTGSTWRVTEKRGGVLRTRGRAEHPGILVAVEEAHARTVRYVTAPIGSTAAAWRADSARVKDTPIVDFVNEVQRRASGADLSSTSAFSLNAEFGPGAITMADMAELYPYDNNVLRAVKISGRQLREYLEFSARYFRDRGRGDSLIDPSVPGFNFDIVSGVDYVIDIAKPIGSRITTLSRNGRPVVDADSFTMALNDYRQSGGGGYAMLRGAPLVYDQQQVIRQLLIDEVQRAGALRPTDYFTQSWRLEPDSVVGPVYRAMRRGPYDQPARTPAPASAAASSSAASCASSGLPCLRIISTNDLHGYLEPWTDRNGVRRGGAAALATAIARARAECSPPVCVSLVVDAGDMMQGPALASLAYGRPVIEVMNAIGYDVAAVGNHEFDWGPDTLRARMREARFPILSANVHLNGEDVPWIPNDTILIRGRYRIGVIGLTTTTAGHRSRAGADGFQFPDPAAMIAGSARALRTRGADVVILVAHTGARCAADGATDCRGEIIELARAVAPSVDAVISGDSHSYINTTIAGVPVVQARFHGQAITVVDIPMAPAGRARATTMFGVRSVFPDSLPADSAVAAIVRRAAHAVERRTSVRVAVLRDSLLRRGDEHALGRLVADAQRVVGRADFAIVNNGGIRRDLFPGAVTYGTVFEVVPFGNRLNRITASGLEMRRYLERVLFRRDRPGFHVSGLHLRYDRGTNVLEARLSNGQPLNDAASYTLVLNEFMAMGGDDFGFESRNARTEVLSITDHQALVDYLRAQPSPYVAATEPRIVRVDR
jgi:2',3'-cyclic-nucleotide 2'-phosphodiesterase/3'-nucleotidase/5'-nucleotidase